MGFVSDKWYSMRLDVISSLLCLCGALLCAFTKPQSGLIGIVLIMTEHITGSLNWFVDRLAQLETDVVSVERIHQYSNKQFAQEQQIKKEQQLTAVEWPSNGCIEFKNVSMKY